MATQPRAPQHGRTAAAAALLVAVGWLTGPAIAAPEPDLFCADDLDATLNVSDTELSATPVNTSIGLLGNHLLKPRVKATAREVFADDDGADSEVATEESAVDAPSEPVSNSSTDDQATPFKRQMYRRDI